MARGPWTLDAYLGESDSPLMAVDGEEGWFPTGDIARIDERGWVTITDRRKDLIRCGGEWDQRGPAGTHCAQPCRGGRGCGDCPHRPAAGRAALLIVVQHAGASLDSDTLLALFEGRVAEWQRPAGALVFPELPRLSTGEVDKRELRALVETVLD